MSTMNRSSFKKVSKNNVYGPGIFEKSALAATGTGINSWNMQGHQYGSDAQDMHKKNPINDGEKCEKSSELSVYMMLS